MELGDKRILLRLSNIRKVFSRGTIDEVTALDGINMDVPEQDFVTIIGSNGAGKSTLLNIIAGIYPPERGGRVFIVDRDITNIPEYKHAAYVGRVYQDPSEGTAAKLTIEENMAMALLRGRSRGLRCAVTKRRQELFRATLAPLGLGLEDRLSTYAATLSGGQRQSMALVMATISKPAILLLDEHIATLDPKTAETVLELTDMIVERERMTTIMVTHNMDIALRYGNRLIMMHKGKILINIGKEEKEKLRIADLIAAFERAAGEEFKDDSVMLSQR
jgi:putative ABC transport system ATP-binding protein